MKILKNPKVIHLFIYITDGPRAWFIEIDEYTAY